ncbi:MAG: zinc dependent phospholipase C family protein [Gemmatimonadetes bacterium]|nr:zinc dependent phospholipase C family protein [Gemmatimonadota bacterium]
MRRVSRLVRLLLGTLLAGAALLLMPADAWAWGPGSHIAIGESVLGALSFLPAAAAEILQAHPLRFLYGSIAADISFAKKYAPEGRHCHHWHVGEEIRHSADSAPLLAVALGYLAHLAADTIAHNFFVPRRLLFTSSTKALGHSYWEHRMDLYLGDRHLSRARDIVMSYDHSDADALFDRVLSHTIFSFHTNRRIFRGMIRFQDNETWQQVFERIVQGSRWALEGTIAERYMTLSFEYVMAYLSAGYDSPAARLDPIGDLNLRLAKKIRRIALAEGAWQKPDLLEEMADDFFPLPSHPLRFWPGAVESELGKSLRGPGEPSGDGRGIMTSPASPGGARSSAAGPPSRGTSA